MTLERCWRRLAALALSGLPLTLDAQALDSWDLKVKGEVSYGTTWRMADRDPNLVGPGNSGVVGLPAVAKGGRNQDDGDLNFGKGDQVSSVLKGRIAAQYTRPDWSVQVGAKAWNDFAMLDAPRPFGNIGNGYQSGVPLNDQGFAPQARFRGILFMEAYATCHLVLAGHPLILSAGDQVLAWGAGMMIGGGLGALNPVDYSALHRPGATPNETSIPVPMLAAAIGAWGRATLEGYWQVRWRASALDGDGTFFSTADYATTAGGKVLVGPGTDAATLAAGSYLAQASTPEVRNGGEYGLGLSWTSESGQSKAGLYAARYHARTPIASGLKTLRLTGPARVAGDPGDLNPAYRLDYPEGIWIYAINGTGRIGPVRIYGEVSHQPNAAFQLNPTDLLNAVASNSANSLLRAEVTALPPGGVLAGSDRLAESQAQAGLEEVLGDPSRAGSLTLQLEAGLRHVYDLPGVAVRRYGRGTFWPPALDPSQDQEGYVTGDACPRRRSRGAACSSCRLPRRRRCCPGRRGRGSWRPHRAPPHAAWPG